VINAGKLAVVMGIETSVPFGCNVKLDVPPATAPRSTPARRGQDLGVRQMELVNKFDNALSGVAGDNGADGAAGQRRRTSSRPARSGTCSTASPRTRGARQQPGRRARIIGPSSRTRCSAHRRALGAGTPALPLYPPARTATAAA
jgi:hypothetical protein